MTKGTVMNRWHATAFALLSLAPVPAAAQDTSLNWVRLTYTGASDYPASQIWIAKEGFPLDERQLGAISGNDFSRLVTLSPQDYAAVSALTASQACSDSGAITIETMVDGRPHSLCRLDAPHACRYTADIVALPYSQARPNDFQHLPELTAYLNCPQDSPKQP